MRGTLSVKVTKATNLPNREALRFFGDISDPYARVTFNAQNFETGTVSNNLNPVWTNDAFVIDVDTDLMSSILQIEVFDKNTCTRDTSLGFCKLDVLESGLRLKASPMKMLLHDGDARKNGGEIEFEISFKAKELLDLLEEEEVPAESAENLSALQGYDIEALIDDSGSMKRKDPGCKRTRWEEQDAAVKLVLSIQRFFDDDGVGISSFHRGFIKGIRSLEDSKFKDFMAKEPVWGQASPLTETLESLAKRLKEELKRPCEDGGEYTKQEFVKRFGVAGLRKWESAAPLEKKKVLLMIFTDGEPDGGVKKFEEALKGILYGDSEIDFRCQIMPCTGKDSEELKWLNKLDEAWDKLDVTDDYETERKEAIKHGKTTFTRGEWIMKALLGGVLAKFDKIDEPAKRKIEKPDEERAHKKHKGGD